ncbi:hypothetical protein PAXINDRAFT_18310 [Paxillus involutus ATCC 200175]|uniref:Uncharacterized protein n=1 Tax=Paxillus involutus ATCC 200175 TaxID=664439 RepID=A0A0C9SP00_PAXIN|nr:hypothetical protein PAXINDRAFT_18310 [Paxillus involutus ATCC 200175]
MTHEKVPAGYCFAICHSSPPSFTVTSALFVPSALDALESIARWQITVVRFFQILEVELAVAQERYVPDDWLDIVDKGLAGPQPKAWPKGGDTVKVLAGVHRGYFGTVIAIAEDAVTLLLDKTMEVVVIFRTFLETHLAQHMAFLMRTIPDIDIYYVLEDFDDVMPGDIALMSVWNTISVLFRDKQWEWLVFTTICDEQYGSSAFRVGNFVQT